MKSLAHQPVKRVGAAAAAVVGLLSITGCGYVHSQPTMIQYSPSDGVNADFGEIEARNIFVVTNDKESKGRLLGALVNTGDEDQLVTIDTGEDTATVDVPANSMVSFEEEKTLVDPAGAAPGMMLMDTTFSTESHQAKANVPVLNGALEEYRTFVPGGSEYTPPPEPHVEH